MSDLLDLPPFADRDDVALLAEMNRLVQRHVAGCDAYRVLFDNRPEAKTFEELPFLHVGAFKLMEWRTDADGLVHQRTLRSSSTTGSSSRIILDSESSALQSRSSSSILAECLGAHLRPLLVLDDPKSLLQRGEVGARSAAAMSLRPLSNQIHFVCKTSQTDTSVDWHAVGRICRESEELLVYGFTWALWTAWAQGEPPKEVSELLTKCRVHFVHSGGWKKLEALKVSQQQFGAALLDGCAPGSVVLDFYGLVEQVGIVYPLCDAGFRHVPRWAAALVRDPWTLQCLRDEPGMLQLLNPLARGAPYHSVLTEDLGLIPPGDRCPCGRRGQRFQLLGRVPRAEIRGCANV